MKPSQFLYSENVKEQKGQKSIITKSQAELRPLVKPASQPKDQNASMIYSLVTLPVKDGKKEEIVFPESLISQHLKLDKEKIVGKNTELARKLKKLKPLDNDLSSSISTPDQEKVKPKNEQLQGPRLQVYIKALNDITGGQFKKTQSHLLFGSIEQKIQKSNVLCLVKFKSLKFFNQYDLTNDKIPGLFCWEVKHKGKSLVKTTPKEYEKVQQDLLDFTFKRHSYESPQVILWKIKNNDEVFLQHNQKKYLGQFNLDNADFVNLTEILDYKGKKIVESTTEKEMFRTMKQTKSYLGNVEFQIIQLGNEQLPQNKHSGIPGSPRTDEEKLRHRLIDLVMSGAQYRWRFDENERLIIEEIQQASQELVAEYIIEQVVDASGKMGDIMITKFLNYADKGRGLDQRLQDMLSNPNDKEAAKGFYRLQQRYKKEEFDQVLAILSQLDQNGQLKASQSYVRTNLKGRKVNFATAEAALLKAGVSTEVIAELLKNDLGLNMFDFFLSSTGLIFDDIVKDLKFDENTSYIMSESKTPPDAAKGSYRIQGRTYRKEHFDQVMNTLAELNANGSLVEVKEELQRMGLKGRVTKKDIENTLAKAGVNANQLIILTTNDLGLNLLDMFLSSDQLANALIAFQQVNLVEEDELNLESISENLFKIIGKKVRRNHQLTAVKEFVISLEKKPELARLFYNYSYAPENYVNDIPPFIQNFNLKNYEHIYILGRMLKLFEKWEVKTPFYEALKQYHVEAKKSIYFEIPCFPKDMDLEDKKASLTLGDLQQNILHEVARRQKWEKLYKAFEKYSKWAFEKDFRGESPFQQMLEKASYDVIKLFFTNYPEQLAERFSELEIVPTLVTNTRKAFEYHFDEEKQKNYLHSLIENPNLSQQELLESLQLVEALVNQSGAKNFNTLKKQKVQTEFTPLLYFLGYLEERSRKRADRVLREIGSSLFIIQLLQVEDDDPEDNNNEGQGGDGGDGKNNKKPQQNELLFKILSKFPETILEKLDDQFKDLNWLTKINNYYQFHHLVKHKQQKKLIQLISQMAQDINKFDYDETKYRDEEYQPNQDILTYFKFMVAILLEIKSLKNRSLDQISQQIIFLLRFWVKKYIELLPSDLSFYDFPHLLRKFKFKNPLNLLELFFNFQYLTVFQELQNDDLQRIDQDSFYATLNQIQNSEGIKQFVSFICNSYIVQSGFEAVIQSGLFELLTTKIIQDTYLIQRLEGEEISHRLQFEDSKHKLFVYLSKNQQLVKPEIYFIFDDMNEQTAKLILDQKISDQFLKLIQRLPKYEDHLRKYNSEVYKKLIAGQNIDIPLTQLIQQNQTAGLQLGKIESFLKRSQNPKHQALLYLFDKDFIATSSTPKFNQSLKELVKTIDIKKSFYQIVNNAQYDKIDAFIGATNAALQKLDLDTIREAISQVAELGYLQITDFPSYLSAVKGKKSDFYISPFDPGAFVKIVGRGQDAIPKIPQDKTDLQILFDETIANPYIYSVSRVSYQKKKIQQIKFPENLNKIRVPMSTFHQLIEMNPGLEEEIKSAWEQGWNKNKKLHQERIEEHLQKDIWLFKYTKHLRQTFLSQNVKSVFFKMESFISAPQSYRKTFDQLLKIYNKAGIPFSQDPEVVKRVIVTGILFNQFQMDTILQLLAPFKVQDFIIVDIVDKIYGLTKKIKNLNQFQKQIQAKNLQNYITFTQKLLKNVNIKKFQQDEDKITQIQELFGSIRTSFKERRTDQVEFKYAFELFSLIIQFDEKELDKFQIKDTLVEIAKQLQKKKPSEKLTLQLIKKYDLKPYSQDYNKILEDKIFAAKKTTIQEFFTNNLFKTLVGKFGDEKVLRILKELFKQKLNKDSKEFLLEQLYNIEFFKTVFFYRATKTYNLLIIDVLHKQIFNSNTMMTKQILQAIIDKGQVEWMTDNYIKESNEEATSALEAAVQEFDDLAIQQSQANEAGAEQEDDAEKDNDGGDVMIEQVNAQDAPKQQKKPKQSIKNQPKTNYLFQASYFKKRLAVILEESKQSIYKQILLRKELENLYNKIEVKKTIIKRKDDPDYQPGQNPFDKKQNKKLNSDENQEQEEIEQLSNDDQTLLVVQAQVLNFYEFFETINKFQLQSHFTQQTTVNIVSRFKLLTEDQLQQHIKSFEELGYEYIVKALKVQRFFQINWNSLDNSFESVLFVIPLMCQRLITPNNLFTRYRSQQELLKIISGSRSKPQIFDQIFEQIRDQYVTIDISKKFNAIQVKQFGFDKGIKIAKRISDEDPEEYYPNIRKMKAVKPWIGADAFLENSLNYKQQVLILNDNNFKQVIDPYFNNINTIQEFCVDPEDIFDIINKEQTDKSLIPHKEVLFPILVNFPQILFFQGYKERWIGTYSLFYNIELSLVIVKSILVNEPNLINDYIDLLFRILSDMFKKEDNEEDQQQQVEQEQPVEDEYIDEEYESEEEVDATESEEEAPVIQQQPAVEAVKPKNNVSIASNRMSLKAGDEKQEDDNVEVVQANDDQFDAAPKNQQDPDAKDQAPSDRYEAPEAKQVQQDKPKKKKIVKVKKTRKVLKPKPQKQEAPFKSEFLDELTNSSMTHIHANIFIQFLLIAISNEKALHSLQNQFIEYKLIKAPDATKQYDKVVTDRLIAAGYKGPFDVKFVNMMESKQKELKQPVLDDVKHIKKILIENENQEAKRFRNLFQVIISQVLRADCNLDSFIQLISQSHPYRLLSQKKANVFQVPLDKDDKFQIEIRQNFDNLDISRDFLDKYFENISSHTSLDKWIQTLYLFRYLRMAKNQINRIENLTFEFNYAAHEILYRFVFKNSKSFDNLVYQVEKVNPGDSIIDSENQYLFKFHIDIIINVAKTQNYPVPYINSKYEEEIQKLFDAYNIEQFKQELDENGPFLKKIPRVIAQGQQINYDTLFKQINLENFRKIKTLITEQYLFLQNEQFENEWGTYAMNNHNSVKNVNWKEQLYKQQLKEGLDLITKYVSDNPTIDDYLLLADRIPILRLRDALRQGQQIDYTNKAIIDGQEYQLYNDRVRPDLKIKILDKVYPLPYSNYQLRQRNATYKVSVGTDLCFPEFYPFLRLHRYVMIPELVSKKQYYEKFDTVIALQQTCNDLNQYSSLFQEFSEQLPELDEDGFFLLPNQQQNVSWPILVADNGYYSASQDSHPLYLTQYLHQKLQLRVDNLTNNYKYNVLSLTEIILNKITRVVQATTNKKCKIQTAVNIFEEWAFFKKVITRIDSILTANDLNVFKFYYIEVNEAHPNSTHQLRPKQEGLDAVFRFGPTNFYVHSNVLIIRLNLALVSENGQSIVNPKSQKQRIRDSTDPTAYDQDIANYLNAIVNYDDLLKQLFAKK